MEQPKYSGVEKRRFKRLNKQFVVRMQPHAGASKTWDMVLIRNISRGGLLFQTPDELTQGMLFDFKINIALNHNAISCVGQVMRVRMFGNPKVCEAGVAFVKINDRDAELIDRTVETLLAKGPDDQSSD